MWEGIKWHYMYEYKYILITSLNCFYKGQHIITIMDVSSHCLPHYSDATSSHIMTKHYPHSTSN